jgi:hypothetical protein
VSFFICEADFPQGVVNSGQGASQPQGGAHLMQRQVGFAPKQAAHLVAVRRQDQGFAARIRMARGDIARAAALLKEFLNHAKRHFEAQGNLIAGAFVTIIGSQDPFTQIQR